MTPPYTLPDGSDVAPGLDAPATGAFEVTTSDTEDLAKPARSLYVGTTGDVKVDTVAGDTVTFAAVPAGAFLPVRVKRVYATGTDADDIVGLY